MAEIAMCLPPMAYGDTTWSAPALRSLSSASELEARATMCSFGFSPRAVNEI